MTWHENFLGFEHLYDAKLRTEDGYQFPIHKVLLAMHSEYFRDLLCSLDPDDTDILVPGIKGSTMKIIIDYIYTSKISHDGENIQDVFVAAYSLGIDKLFQSSKIQAVRSLTTSNCIQMYLAASRIEELGILGACVRFIEINFNKVMRDIGSRFQDLPPESIKKFLLLDSLNVSSERKVWDAIVYWILKDTKERKLCLKNLIPCVRLSNLDGELAQEILSHPFVAENSDNEELVKMISSPKSDPKHRIPGKIYVITKFFISFSDYSDGIKIFLTYDQGIDFWRKVSSNMFCPNIVLHATGSLIMMFDTISNVIFSFDVSKKSWLFVNPPSVPRKEYSVVKLMDHIYILGGIRPGNDTDDDITSVERYNIQLGVWEIITPTRTLSQSSAVVIENQICIIGTTPGIYSEIIAAQLYNPVTDTWLPMQPPEIYRRQFAMIVYQEQIWVIGGNNSEGLLKSVEVYKVKEDKWSQFEELPFPYVLPKAVTVDDDLYAYDNHSGEIYEFRGPPVRWDKWRSEWQVVEPSSPFYDLHLYQFCAVEDPEVILGMRRENRDPCTEWVESPFYKY